MRRILLIACATALVVAFTVSLQQSTRAAADLTPPPVPAAVRVEPGNKLFLVGHATGTQNYVCLPAGAGVKYVLFTPQATLFSDGAQVTTHFFSPNPEQDNAIRATWQHSRDTSTVWAEVQDNHMATDSTDPEFVAKGAVAWLLLTAVGHKVGPDGGDLLTKTTFVQRLNTAGGVAPATGCSSSADVGHQAFVPYTADYLFYKKA